MRNIYLLKDAILKVLVDYDNSFELGIDANKKLLSFDEINRKIYKYNKASILDALHTMAIDKEIYCSFELDKSKFYILEPGRRKFIEETYLKQDIDQKVQRISYTSLKINKLIPLYALIITLISGGVPLLIYYLGKETIQKSEITMPQLQQALQKQEEMYIRQYKFQDSLLKLLNDK